MPNCSVYKSAVWNYYRFLQVYSKIALLMTEEIELPLVNQLGAKAKTQFHCETSF